MRRGHRYIEIPVPRKSIYDRVYTAREVAAYGHRFGHPEESVDRMEGQFAIISPTWRRVRVPIADLSTLYDETAVDDPDIAPYVARRLRGSRFPAIVLGAMIAHLPLDGNHRVRAAKIVGDEAIDAFVPWAEGG